MRLIHTADWHLGRVLHGAPLIEDQAHVLDQLVDLARQVRPEAVVIAGDLYDRAVPPPEAVELLDEVFCRLVLDGRTRVIAISGNHDSGARLGFASRLLARQGVHVVSALAAASEPVVLEDAGGPVKLFALPYAEPPVVREHLGDGAIRDHDGAMRALLADLERRHPRNGRRLLVAHAFVVGGEACDSERPLSVGGSAAVDANCLRGFEYVALGHLHRPQHCGDDRVQYAGSLLKYSFSEAAHAKAVSVVELNGDGVRVERVALSPRRDVRCLAGTLREILARADDDPHREDYVQAVLADDGPVLDPMGRLREAYPNALHVERSALLARGELAASRPDHRRVDDRALFAAFFEQVTGQPPSPEQQAAYAATVEAMRRREQEAGA